MSKFYQKGDPYSLNMKKSPLLFTKSEIDSEYQLN